MFRILGSLLRKQSVLFFIPLRILRKQTVMFRILGSLLRKHTILLCVPLRIFRQQTVLRRILLRVLGQYLIIFLRHPFLLYYSLLLLPDLL